ncbi:hypothetical protein HBI53_110000 [Parastagonospora nodorum]|nr:hypothetical protein HBI53_110000 [Parastagonospora nodorum]
MSLTRDHGTRKSIDPENLNLHPEFSSADELFQYAESCINQASKKKSRRTFDLGKQRRNEPPSTIRTLPLTCGVRQQDPSHN